MHLQFFLTMEPCSCSKHLKTICHQIKCMWCKIYFNFMLRSRMFILPWISWFLCWRSTGRTWDPCTLNPPWDPFSACTNWQERLATSAFNGEFIQKSINLCSQITLFDRVLYVCLWNLEVRLKYSVLYWI